MFITMRLDRMERILKEQYLCLEYKKCKNARSHVATLEDISSVLQELSDEEKAQAAGFEGNKNLVANGNDPSDEEIYQTDIENDTMDSSDREREDFSSDEKLSSSGK